MTSAPESIDRLRAEARECQACPLWTVATQTVFGEGPVPAPAMLVGEQPGDEEDRSGRPFVGPAGRVLDAALESAGITRSEVYLTNAVKHFKWKPRGKRRIHETPGRSEVTACNPWLRGEIEAVRPEVLVVLGATAAKALLGPSARIGDQRGRDLTETGLAPHVVVTAHPSAVLRVPDRTARESATQALISDLALARSLWP